MEKAAHYYQLGASADDAEAQFRLGLFHLHGLGVEKSVDKAVPYLQRAAQQGQNESIKILREMGVGF